MQTIFCPECGANNETAAAHIAALEAENKELLEALKDIADTLPGDEGLEIAMKYGFDAELVAARAAIAKAGNE